MALVCVVDLNTRYRVPFLTTHNHFHTYRTHVKVTILNRCTATDGEITSSREPHRSTQRQRHRIKRTVPHSPCGVGKDRAANRPWTQRQSLKRPTPSWTRWRLEPHDRDGSVSRSLRSAMTMNLRRSEDEKERASRLHDVGEALAIAQRVQLGQPSPTVTCLRRALGHTIKQGSSQCVMNRVMGFEGLAPGTKRRPFCERRALASPDASSRRRLVRRFHMCVTRMYLPRSSASRDSIRVLTGR